MEHTLGEVKVALKSLKATRLNPCFSGTYSRSVAKATEVANKVGLNPCFSGTYSRRIMSHSLSMLRMVVLILVLVEHTLGDLKAEMTEMEAELS